MKTFFNKILAIGVFTIAFSAANAQSVGINEDSSSPDPSAILDVSSTTKGLLIPRMTTSERSSISSPADGLMVFDTDESTVFYYGGTMWQRIDAIVVGSSSGDVPDSPFAGQLYFDLSGDKLYIYTSAGWAEVTLGTPVEDFYGSLEKPSMLQTPNESPKDLRVSNYA